MKTLIIAGHGKGPVSNDSGAVGGGYNERDTMRALALKISTLIPHLVDVYDTTKDMFQYTNAGGGMWATPYKEVIELHMDAERVGNVSGGHVIIHTGYKPDALDLRLRDAIRKLLGIKGQFKPNGFSYRTNLLNLYVAGKRNISYRLLELGFITNAADRNAIITNVDNAALVIAGAIANKDLTQSKPTPPTPPKVVEELVTPEQEVHMSMVLNQTSREAVMDLNNQAVKDGIFKKLIAKNQQELDALSTEERERYNKFPLSEMSDDDLKNKLVTYQIRKELFNK